MITKCFIKEDSSDKAVEVIDAHIAGHISLIAPSLIVYEIGNVFWKHPQISAEKAHEFIGRFLDLQIGLKDVWSDAELLKSTCALAKAGDMSFYDASYVSLAQQDKSSLVTADNSLRSKASDAVLLLEELEL